MSAPTGIAGLHGREPIGAALAAGHKGPKGNPVDKDIYWILLPARRDDANIRNGVRDPHPSFATFNNAIEENARKYRRSIPIRIDHARREDCFDWARHARILEMGGKKLIHPAMRVVCRGNGVTAIRWDPTQPDIIPTAGKDWRGYKDIPCPGDQCPFAIANGPGKPQCGPWMRFVARFDWPERKFPNIPFVFESQSWNTIAFFVGFFESFESHCRDWGFDPKEIPLFGYPAQLQLNEEMRPGKKFFVTRPIPTMGDFNDWIRAQQARIGEAPKMITAGEIIGELEDLTSGPQGIPRA